MNEKQSNLYLHLYTAITTQETFNSVEEFLRGIKIDVCEDTSENIKKSFEYDTLKEFVTSANYISVYSTVNKDFQSVLKDDNNNVIAISAPCYIVDDESKVFIILKYINK